MQCWALIRNMHTHTGIHIQFKVTLSLKVIVRDNMTGKNIRGCRVSEVTEINQLNGHVKLLCM